MKTMEVITSFMDDCSLRGLSPKTLKDYNRYANDLPIISPKFPPKPVIIQHALANVKGEYSRDYCYRVFRAIDNYAHTRFNTPNFMKSVTRPRIQKKVMSTITPTELNLLAWTLNDAPLRERAVIALFVDTAIRIGEAAHLQRKDIQDDRLIVHGKTGYRVVPVSPVTKDLLLSLPVHDDGFVFHGRNNRPLRESGLYKIARRFLVKIGYSGSQFGPQVLRRSFGVFHLRDGGDLKSLSLILGHSNITTTANYYTPLLTNDIIEIHHRHSPGRVFEGVK